MLYEDAQLAVVEKPSGLRSTSPLEHCEVTAELALPAYLSESSGSDPLDAPRLLYSLESGTTGLLLAAKTASAETALRSAASCGKLQRRYRAMACGMLEGSARTSGGGGGEFVLRGEVRGVARAARARLVAMTRSEQGWLSTVDVWLLAPGASTKEEEDEEEEEEEEEKHTVRELLLQNGAPLLGHRGTGFGKGSWIACVELIFLLEPAPTFKELLAVGAPIVCEIEIDTEPAGGQGGPGEERCQCRCGRFVLPEPEKFERLRAKEAARWERITNEPRCC